MCENRGTFHAKVVATALVLLAAGFSTGCKEVNARRDIQKANAAYYESRYDVAVTLYTGALEAQPDLAIGWFNLGLAHLALFSPTSKAPEIIAHGKAAVDAFQKYVDMMPEDPQGRDYLLDTAMNSGHYEVAVDYFNKKLAINPDDKDSIVQMAQIYTKAGKFDDAIKWHKRHADIETTPDAKADVYYTIGTIEWHRLYLHPEVAGADRVRVADEGIGWLQKADSVRPNHGATLSYMNLLYRERAAAHEASYARAVDTASAQVYYKLASDVVKKQ